MASENFPLPISMALRDHERSQVEKRESRRQSLINDDPPIMRSQPLQQPANLWLELKGEMLGTFVLVVGIVSLSATLARKEADAEDNVLDIASGTVLGSLAGAMSVVAAFIVSFDTSGAHINPAVTFSFILFDGFPLRKGLLYMIAQMIGSFLAALWVCVLFTGMGPQDEKYITNFYHTGPAPGTDMLTAFLAEIQCTALLLCGIKFLGHGTDPKPNKMVMGCGIAALVFFITCNFGYLSGGCLNPARELPPRIVRFIDASLRGKGVEGTFDTWEWVCPTIAPMIGGPLGIAIYKMCSDSSEEVLERGASSAQVGSFKEREELELS